MKNFDYKNLRSTHSTELSKISKIAINSQKNIFLYCSLKQPNVIKNMCSSQLVRHK